MTSRQEIESQLAQYEGNLNAVERERAQALADIDHGGREMKRLEVLVELGEVEAAQLVSARDGVLEAGRRLKAVNERLMLARRAWGELQERLEAARAEEATERWRARRDGYRDAATELLALLEQAEVQYERLQEHGEHWWRDGFRSVSKASKAAMQTWPEQLRHDLELLRARYGEKENE
jgi:chromosome segregation ATPase